MFILNITRKFIMPYPVELTRPKARREEAGIKR